MILILNSVPNLLFYEGVLRQREPEISNGFAQVYLPFFHNNIHPMISFILGIYNPKYNSMDHFALIPNIAIISSYNDMLSAHKPFENFPSLIKKVARSFGATAQVSSCVPAMCDGITQGRPAM